MKEFHRNYACRRTELEKKGRRVKNENKQVCKCFAPFVRLHYYDCPAVKKACPIHGNNRHRGARDEKGELEKNKNMIISFHPSSKTERLFQPVKTLLAQCTPETKVNLQYYSPKSTTSKESLKHQQIQTNNTLDGNRALNSNVFVEKTKSFVADKTNKMKKLKQCFHSPCNSITHKSRSQTSIKEKFQEIFRDDRKKLNDLGSLAPDKPPDELKYDSNLTWFSNKFDFKDWEKLSAEKTNSDFITVTQRAKNNLINHKIFEIKHKKGLNDYPFMVRLPERSSQLVYSSLEVDHPMKKTRYNPYPQETKQVLENSPPSEGSRGKDSKQRRDEELSSSENSQSSSSSSVYFTPFIFVPAVASSESHGKEKTKTWEDEAVQVGSKEHGDGKKAAVIQQTQTPSLQSEQELAFYAEESKTESVLLQTDLERQSGDSAAQEWYLRSLEVAESFTTRGTQTDESLFRLDKSVGDSRRLSELSSEIFALASKNEPGDYHVQGTQTSGSPSGLEAVESWQSKDIRTVEVQTSRYRREGGLSNTTTWTMTTLDKVVQTESCKVVEVQRLWSFKVNKSQMAAPKLSNKTTQTIFTRSESLEEVSEFIDLDSSNVTFVVKPFSNQESDQAIDKMAKAWWGKSRSDSELYGSRRCSCLKPEYVIPLPQSCSCNQSETTRDSSTPAKCDEKNSHFSSNFPSSEKNSSNNTKVFKLESKADKSLGTDDGSQRFYKRAEKALGTDSWMDVPPEMLGRADKALGTDSGVLRMSRRADKALGTESEVPLAPKTSRRPGGLPETGNKADRSPRKVEYSSKAEQTSLNEECPPTPLSDLSELTKIIQEFFEKTGKTTWRTCPCESSAVAGKKVDRTVTTDSRRAKKECVDHAVGVHVVNGKKVDSAAMTNTPKKPKEQFANAETQAPPPTKGEPGSDKSGNPIQTDRIKIRRSVLLDENETKTRFICSVCAGEISTFSMNAATNTENLQNSPRKKENVASVSGEVSELVEGRTIEPKKLVSAPEPAVGARVQYRDANEGGASVTSKPLRESIRKSSKSFIPTPRPGPGATRSDRAQQSVKWDPVRRTTTVTISKPKVCICNNEDEVCTKDSCPNREANPNVPTTSRATAPRADLHPSLPRADHPGMASSQSRSSRRSVEKNRTQRRNLEPYYPVLIKSPWPRDFSWNVPEKSQSSIPEYPESAALQQKRSHERETEPADIPAGKKVRPESEKLSGQYFMFGNAASEDLHMGDRVFFPNKAGFILIPSLSTSSVATPKKHTLSQWKIIKSEEKVREPNQQQRLVPPEGLTTHDPLDLSSTKSCRLTPIRLECDDRLFECRVCKSLTFMKTDKDGVVFHWRHGLLACRPTVMQHPNPTACDIRRNDSESLHRNESSTQNLDEFFEESSHFSDRSDSPSPYELLPEETGETTEEERDSSPQRPKLNRESNEASSTLNDLFYPNAGVSSKTSKFWSEE